MTLWLSSALVAVSSCAFAIVSNRVHYWRVIPQGKFLWSKVAKSPTRLHACKHHNGGGYALAIFYVAFAEILALPKFSPALVDPLYLYLRNLPNRGVSNVLVLGEGHNSLKLPSFKNHI